MIQAGDCSVLCNQMCLMRQGQRFFLYSHKIDHCMLVVFAVQEQQRCFIWLDYDFI